MRNRTFFVIALAIATMPTAASTQNLNLQSIGSEPYVASLHALETIPSSAAPVIMRLDYAAGNGAPPLAYKPSSIACSLNAGRGNGGSQVRSSDGRCWLAQFPAGGADVREWGAVCNGRNDDAAAINAALSSGISPISVPASACRATRTIIVPAGVELDGQSFFPGNPPTGSTILCDAAVSPCVALGDPTHNTTEALRRILVSRSGGQPLPNVLGIEIYGYNPVLEDVMVYNHGVGYYFHAVPSAGAGISAMLTRTYGGKIADAYFVVDSWPELRISQCRYGMNGTGDFSARAFMRFEGGLNHTAAGPNTIEVSNCQFNQGGQKVSHWLEFVKLNGSYPADDVALFNFSQIHVEGISSAAIYSDQTWNQINKLKISDSSFNSPGSPFFALNPATNIGQWTLLGNYIAASNFILAPSGTISETSITDNDFTPGLVRLNPGKPSDLTFVDNKLHGGLEVGGRWGALVVSGDVYYRGTVTNRASGTIIINEPQFGHTAASK